MYRTFQNLWLWILKNFGASEAASEKGLVWHLLQAQRDTSFRCAEPGDDMTTGEVEALATISDRLFAIVAKVRRCRGGEGTRQNRKVGQSCNL